MMDYYQTDGQARDFQNRADKWGDCTSRQKNKRCLAPPYRESFSSPKRLSNMTIFEPCNYASNVAYYHAATRVCDFPNWVSTPPMINAQKRAFTILAVGSSIMHGSHTFVGYSFDNKMIGLIAYLAYQNSVASIAHFSPIIGHLSPVARN